MKKMELGYLIGENKLDLKTGTVLIFKKSTFLCQSVWEAKQLFSVKIKKNAA